MKLRTLKSQNLSVHLGVVVSRACVDILCHERLSVAVLLIAKGWLKWVKREMWDHSGRC